MQIFRKSAMMRDAIHHAVAAGKLLTTAKTELEAGQPPEDWIAEHIKYHHAHLENIACGVSREVGEHVSVDRLLEMIMTQLSNLRLENESKKP